MRSTTAGIRKAVKGRRPQASTDHIWISDDLLADTFACFTRCHRSSKRYGSNVPGPLEARKRLDKRRHNSLASHGLNGTPPPSPGLLAWLFSSPKPNKGMIYEPPTLRRAPEQPSIFELLHDPNHNKRHDSPFEWPGQKASAPEPAPEPALVTAPAPAPATVSAKTLHEPSITKSSRDVAPDRLSAYILRGINRIKTTRGRLRVAHHTKRILEKIKKFSKRSDDPIREYRKWYFDLWVELSWIEKGPKYSKSSKYNIAYAKLHLDVLHQDESQPYFNQNCKKDYSERKLVSRALQPITTKFIHFERRHRLITKLLSAHTRLRPNLVKNITRLCVETFEGDLTAIENQEPGFRKNLREHKTLHFSIIGDMAAEEADVPNDDDDVRLANPKGRSRVQQRRTILSDVDDLYPTKARYTALVQWLILLRGYDSNVRDVCRNRLRRKVDWNGLIPMLGKVPHGFMLRIFRACGTADSVALYLRARFGLPGVETSLDTVVAAEPTVVGSSAVTTAASEPGLNPRDSGAISDVAQEAFPKLVSVIDVGALSTFMISLLQQIDSEPARRRAQIAFFNCLRIILRMWGSIPALQFVGDVRMVRPFPSLLFSGSIQHRLIPLLRVQADRATISSDPGEALRVIRLRDSLIFPSLADKDSYNVLKRVIEDGSMSAVKLVNALRAGSKISSNWQDDEIMDNGFRTLTPAFVDFMNDIAYQIAISPKYTHHHAFRALVAIYHFLRRRRAPLRPLFSRALVMAGVIRHQADNRWVGRRQFSFIHGIVAEVEGEEAAREIYDSWYNRRGELIALAASVYEENGIGDATVANVTVARQLGYMDPEEKWYETCVDQWSEGSLSTAQKREPAIDTKQREQEDI